MNNLIASTHGVLATSLALALSIVLSACGSAGGATVDGPEEDAGGTGNGLVSALRGWGAPATATHTPTAPPTATPTETPTPRPTLTPRPHPLSIDALRGRSYDGGTLSIDETLSAGNGYDRHVVSYNSDGLKINALLTEPRGEVPATGWPVVVFNHGYIPPREYRTTERYVAYVDAFARNGYIVVKPDYRGHGDSQGLARGGYSNPDYTIDVLNVVEAIRRWPSADPDRVGMWGHSMGGYITLRAMVVTDTVKAGVIWGGVVASYPDLFSRWHRSRGSAQGTPATPRSRSSWRDSLVRRYGAPEDSPDFWNSISANAYLDDLSGPLQLHHGTADASVPYEFSQGLLQQVHDVGGDADLLTYDGDNHNISGNLQAALRSSVAFFDQHVKGDEAPPSNGS